MAPSESRPEKPKTKKSIQLATFLRLGIVACLPNRWLKRKSADNLLFGSPIPLCGDGRESLIEKKLQRSQFFVFATSGFTAMGCSFATSWSSQRADSKNARLSNDVVQILQSEGVCSLLLSPWFRLLLLTIWMYGLTCVVEQKQDAVIDVPAKWVEIVHKFNQAVKLELKWKTENCFAHIQFFLIA